MINKKSGSVGRRYACRLVAALLVLGLFLGIRTSDVSAATRYTAGKYQVTSSTLNVRSAAGAGYKKLGTLKKGEVYAVSEIRNTRWGKISYKGSSGWINLGYTKKYTTTLAADNHMVSHRGYWTRTADENTAKAFHAAGKAGFWGIEGDLRLNEDGKPVMSHDSPAADDACSFETYLDICKQYGATAIIDLKWGCESELKNMVKLVEKKGMLKTAVFQCSIERYLKIIRDANDDARIWFLCSSDARVAEVPDVVKRIKAEAVNASREISDPQACIKKWKPLCKVCIYNLDTRTLRTRFSNYGAYYIMTNKP